MNLVDIAIVVVIVVPTLIFLRMGIIKAVLSLVGLIVGVILAGQFYEVLSTQLSFIPQAGVAEIVAYAIILIGVMIVAAVLARLLKWVTSMMMLGWVNKLGGAAFGFVLGVLLCSALLAIWAKYLGTIGIVSQSILAAILLDRFPLVLALLPGEFDAIRSFFR